jgi:putative heme-binding domain-containing protein
MDEKLYQPRWDGQAAYIIPPIMNYHNGPTGMVYNPGTALGSDWKNKFFLVEFVGNPARSPIWSFGLKPKGASFVLDGEKNVLSGLLPTGIRFGPDGALYVADWINGWDAKNYGRVWKLDVTGDKNDLKDLRAETKRLMQLTYSTQTVDMLYSLLSNPDMRIRQKAQFELANRRAEGAAALNKATAQTTNQLARIHGIWGLGQLARQDKTYGKPLVALLTDKDPEIVAQAAKVIGDEMLAEAGPTLMPLLASQHPRVKFFSAQALGRIHDQKAVEPLLAMIKANNDDDVYLRHAAVLALSRIGQVEPMAALAKSPDKSLRIASVLVLRRLKSDKVASFLNDNDEYVATEAARAINDDESIPTALPALASALNDKRFKSEALLRRAINACLRVGGNEQLNQLLAFSKRTDVDKSLRAEALATLGTWANPSVLDRVDGRYRGNLQHDLASVQKAVQPSVNDLLQASDPTVLVAAAQMASNLGLANAAERMAAIQRESGSPEVRGAMLTALNTLRYAGIESALKLGMSDANADVRTVALGLMRGQNLSGPALAEMSKTIFEKGSEKEQQQLIQVLGAMPVSKTEPILLGLIDRMAAKTLPPSLALELNEAIDSTKSAPLIAKLAPFRSTGMTVADYQDALFGGDRQAGRRYFMTNSTGQCVRCHAIGGQGGEVGPSLTNIGNVLTRDQLLQALIEPSARLAPGFGSVMLTLADGQVVNGILMQESGHELVLKTTEAEPLKIAVSRIAKRENMPSSMPPMGYLLSKREIRDVVEFLSNLKGGR